VPRLEVRDPLVEATVELELRHMLSLLPPSADTLA
jgi:hypothetical protein